MGVEKVFVYGTLKKGFWNNDLMEGSLFMGEFITKQKFVMIHTGFPIVSTPIGEYKKFAGYISGELYAVSKGILLRLDELEGHPNWYVRIKTPLVNRDGLVEIAWIYWQHPEQVGLETANFIRPDKNNILKYVG